MKTYLLVLIIPLLYFSNISTHLKRPMNEMKNSINLDDLLSSDYRDLAYFSETLKENGITREYFYKLFWEGAIESLSFYKSSKFIDRSLINQFIETKLYKNPDLEHPLKMPEIIEPDLTMAFNTLNEFSGEWHGKWQTMNVHHRWLPVRECTSATTDGYTIVGFQSCFTGDGFGWNYVIKGDNKIAVLGFVYHFNDKGKISKKSPHYAFMNPNGQLTWVSDNHIYYEFICDNTICKKKRHYVITGAQYEKENIKLVTGFQAVYLSENRTPPPFKNWH